MNKPLHSIAGRMAELVNINGHKDNNGKDHQSAKATGSASAELFQIFSTFDDAVILISKEGTTVLGNSAAVTLLGLDPTGWPIEEVTKKLNLSTTDGLPVPYADLPIKHALQGHASSGQCFCVIDENNQTIYLTISSHPLILAQQLSGAILRISRKFKSNDPDRHITDLERESSALKAIFDSAPEAIVVVDENCRLIMSNPKARWLYDPLSFTPPDFLTEKPDCHSSGNSSSEIIALPLSRTVFQGEIIYDFEMEFKQPNTPVKHILINTSPIWDQEGKITGGVGIFHDITERKLEKLELQRIRQELADRVEIRTRELSETVITLKNEIKERAKIENKLRLSEAKLKKISKKMLDALEADRKTIAKELHDSIGASLAAIKFSLEEKLTRMTSTPPNDLISLESIVSYLMDTIKETKRISANLRPSTMDDLGLSATITWFCREFKTFYKNIEIDQNIEIDEDDISETMKIVIYRILQEAMTNAAKHGRPDRIGLALKRRGMDVLLTISDDGLGFDPGTGLISMDPLSGHGISGMKERAEICGGNISIESRSGGGTRVAVTIPIATKCVRPSM